MPDVPLPAPPLRLKRRADFVRAASGKRFHGEAFSLQAVARPQPEVASEAARIGFTVTKKIGTAVVRNRLRRRLKAALRTLDDLPARPGHDYVLVARPAALSLAFAALQAEALRAFGRIDAAKPRTRPAQRKAPPKPMAQTAPQADGAR